MRIAGDQLGLGPFAVGKIDDDIVGVSLSDDMVVGDNVPVRIIDKAAAFGVGLRLRLILAVALAKGYEE